MTSRVNIVSLQLAAASATAVCASQSGTAATALTINGGSASGGVATLDVARRIIITSAGNDSSNSFTLTGTNRQGAVQSEVITGANAGAAASLGDYLTVTSIVPTNNTASTVTAGTNATASSNIIAVDYFANPANYGAQLIVGSGNTNSLEITYDDPGDNYAYNGVNTNWVGATSFSAITATANGTVTGPVTGARLTQTAGTAKSTLKLIQPFVAGGA